MEVLEQELSSVSIDRWFRNLYPSEISQDTLIVDVPDEFFKNWIEDHYLELILSAMRDAGSSVVNFKLKIVPRVPEPSEQSAKDYSNGASFAAPGASSTFAGPPRQHQSLNQQYSFEQFVVGPSNRFAHAASLAVADQPAKAYNPLFIYGPVGLGKTHLMQAIGQHGMQKNPQANVLYITSEKFTNQLINAIQNQTTLNFTKPEALCAAGRDPGPPPSRRSAPCS